MFHGLAHGQEKSRTAEAIQDNSFLVEEAYNQEAGVVQHIFTAGYDVDRMNGEDDRSWDLAFTQEWPFLSQRHQLSYTVPYGFLDGSGGNEHGFGDVLLNYRFQALFESDDLPAFAPRFSIILPTGDESKGLGDDTLGYQINLPFSKVVHDRWTLHVNAGVTLFPDFRERNPISYNLSGSAIYAVSREFNLMVELLGDWVETVQEDRSMDREFQAVISPGLRHAFNTGTSQLVLGIAAPLGLNSDAPDFGAFVYASFEHFFKRNAE